jgi:hypothetical protein
MAAVSVAVQYDGVLVVEAVPTHLAEPRVVLPFVNCTLPVGGAPNPEVATRAVSSTLPPEVVEDGLLVTVVVVDAWVIVIVRVLLTLVGV